MFTEDVYSTFSNITSESRDTCLRPKHKIMQATNVLHTQACTVCLFKAADKKGVWVNKKLGSMMSLSICKQEKKKQKRGNWLKL